MPVRACWCDSCLDQLVRHARGRYTADGLDGFIIEGSDLPESDIQLR